MKKILITGLLLAFTATQLLSQNVKEGVMSFALSQQKQASVSTSPTTQNAGTWDTPPAYYKSVTTKFNTLNVIQSIAAVMHNDPNYYSSNAKLVLVQGELSGFFNVTEPMVNATPIRIGKFAPTVINSTTEGGLNVALATGRHVEPNPNNGKWPPGHHQPWGQIYIKDTGKSPMLCENVTFFFAVTVQECYDCFYLNSIISDSSFKYKSSTSGGPPCCSAPVGLTGNGKDRYYMTLEFDNTINNPYLNIGSEAWVGGWGQNEDASLPNYNPYKDVVGLNPTPISSTGIDGIEPDFLEYNDSITTQAGLPSPNVLRFTLNGIMTYTWNLKLLNKTDLVPDFIGSASYPCNGYGFAGLVCAFYTGTVSIAERTIASTSCCLDKPWYESWYGVGWDFKNNSETATPINVPPDLSHHIGFNEANPLSLIWGTE